MECQFILIDFKCVTNFDRSFLFSFKDYLTGIITTSNLDLFPCTANVLKSELNLFMMHALVRVKGTSFMYFLYN